MHILAEEQLNVCSTQTTDYTTFVRSCVGLQQFSVKE